VDGDPGSQDWGPGLSALNWIDLSVNKGNYIPISTADPAKAVSAREFVSLSVSISLGVVKVTVYTHTHTHTHYTCTCCYDEV